MNFVVITHVPHIVEQHQYFAYAPYVREMNIWAKYSDTLIIVAPVSNAVMSVIDCKYVHPNTIEFIPISAFNVLDIKSVFETFFKIPIICWRIYKAMQKADHIHLRCPGNIGLLGCIVQILFPNTIKTAKYAGNWDPNSKQPLSYKLQKWILSNSFLTKNMQVLVYGEWENSSTTIKPFFTATYLESDKLPIVKSDLNTRIHFVFVGSLTKGKNPLYAIQLVKRLCEKGYKVCLDLYGEGAERHDLEYYIYRNNLSKIITIKGNQTLENLKKAYLKSHFVILPSDSEGWPKAIAEGMFWGCVPLATQVSCVPYMLDLGQRGVLLEKNLEADVMHLESIINNQNDFDLKSKKASDWSRKFTLNYFEDEIKKIIQQ